LKKGNVLSSLLFNFALEYAIRRVQAKDKGFELNGTHQLTANGDRVNTSGESVHTMKKTQKLQ
jgi:hypothetical protein